MAASDPRHAPGAPRAHSEQEPAYDGAAGQTRLRSLHVSLPNGFVRTVQVYDAVNTATHPHLREPALSGALHRFETGEVLAVPFVFHDPHGRKLALVVPELMRHEELRLRAELLAQIARDTEHPVPSYVRDATSVVGTAALAAYLERPNDSAASAERAAKDGELTQRESALAQRESTLAQRESALAQREGAVEQRKTELEAQIEALGQREGRLHARAEEVTRREDELREFLEEIEAAQADIAIREQELEARFEALTQREGELAQRADAAPARARADDVVQLVDDEVEEVNDVAELEPLATSPGEISPDDLGAAVQLVDEPSAPRTVPPAATAGSARPHLGGVADAGAADALADVEDDLEDDVEELDEVEAIGEVTGVHADLPREDTDLRRREPPRSEPPPSPIALPASEPPAPPSVAPPPSFFERRHGAPATAVADEQAVRVFVRLPEGKDDLLDADHPGELLAQLVVVEEHPVCLLSVVDERDGRTTVLRAPLDPRSADDRRVLEALRRRFAAELVVFSAAGRYLRRFEVTAPREVNVARILERVSRMRAAAAVDANTAIERVLAAPPPVRAKDHPFGEADAERELDAHEAQDELDRLAEWSTHDKLDHALLVLSIPRDRVDGTVRRVLAQAVRHGLALPNGLPERAVSLGVAEDVPSLLTRQIAALAETTRREGRGGLAKERVAENWERLLKAAADNEVAIDGDTHELAWKVIREVKGGEEGAVDPAKLPQMGPPELVMLLEHPRHRRDAAIELCRRKDPALAETVCKAVRKMPRSEVVRVVPRVAELGEEAGDAMIDGLSARKTFVRQAFALALGHLKLRRAVVPLVHLLASEESEVWREHARIVGSFGNASLRNVTRQLRDPKGMEERYIWTLAHLANNGCAKQIERLTSDELPAVATMAAEAMTLRERARTLDQQIRGAAPLSVEDAVSKFSRRFYQELEGRAPADDLEDAAGPET